MNGNMMCRNLVLFLFLASLTLSGNAVAGEVPVFVDQIDSDRVQLEFHASGYQLDYVGVNGRTFNKVSLGKESRYREAGEPALPFIARSVIIPNDAHMKVDVVEKQYVDIENVDIIPSKGLLPRTVDPSSVPYRFGDAYKKDAFFPGHLATLGEPYIMRDYRGVVVKVEPFQYNPKKRILRVFTYMKVEVKAEGMSQINVLTPRSSGQPKVRAFNDLYRHHFVNADFVQYGGPSPLYSPLDEDGDLLIICYDSWTSNMQALANHKNSNGVSTTVVGVSTIGNNATSIKNYIQNLYDTSNLAFVLLVGDAAQVATPTSSGGSSDPSYAKLAGSDDYPDIMVGRFSAETAAQVDTMVQRTIDYENIGATKPAWYWRGIGIASDEGTGGQGDDGESDIQHMNNVRTELLGYNYTSIDQVYDPGASASTVTSGVNSGRGVINYVGHGSTYSWATTGYSASHINALTNTDMLPFILSVACVVGQFDGYTCFCESWIRATHNGSPSGAVAIYGSSINQSWAPPMEAQDEFNHLLTLETYDRLGSYYYASSCSMMDKYGSGGVSMYDTWHIFGDPSLQIWGSGSQPDTTPPSPDPMTWATAPHAASSTSISMTATTAADLSGVQYYFDCLTTGGHDSGWQSSASYTDSGLSPSTSYTYRVMARDMSSNQNQTGYSPNASATTDAVSYPTISGNTSYEYIDRVQVGGIDNSSGNDSGYGNYTSIVADIEAGQAVSVTLTPGFASSSYNEYWKIWIDLNNDADFDDAGEELFSGSGSSAVSGSITIPSGTSPVTTRMRVVMKYNSAPPNSGSIGDGEAEDYTVNITDQPEDTTPPSPDPMTWATAPAATGSTSISMTATAATDPSGVEYYFDCVTTGGHDSGWQDNTTYEDTGLDPDTTYTYRVKARDKSPNQNETGYSANASATTETGGVTYPTISGSTGYEYVNRVQIGGIDNTSGNDGGYGDYTTIETDMMAGGSVSCTLTPGFVSSSYTEYWKVWIDFNHDGDFTDTGEEVFSGQGSSAVSGTISIPASASVVTTRMRVVMKYGGAPSSSGSIGDGEAEDYTVNITAGDSTPPVPNPMYFATPPHATGTTSIAMVATTASDASGVEYYFDCVTTGGHDSGWQDSASYTDIGLSPNTTYTYRVKARDKSANQNETGHSSNASATTEQETVTYPAISGNTGYEYIQRVVIGGIDNTSGDNGGYGDYTTVSTNLTIGGSASCTLTPGFKSGSYTEYWKVWIDLNHDGDFTDAGEELFSGSGSSTVNGSISIPAGTSPVTTRMRVVMKYNSAPPSSGSIGDGEAEDYTVTLMN